MLFTLIIQHSPQQSHGPRNALQFAKELINQNHRIYRLFFYREAVELASSLPVYTSDESNIQVEWQAFIKEYNLDAVVCIAAALRRGILDQTEANRYHKTAHNMNENFTLSGLGQLVDAVVSSDRVIRF